MLANHGLSVAEDIGRLLQRSAHLQHFRRECVAESKRRGARNARDSEYGPQGSLCVADERFGRAAPTSEEVNTARAVSFGRLRQSRKSHLQVGVPWQTNAFSVLGGADENLAAPNAILF